MGSEKIPDVFYVGVQKDAIVTGVCTVRQAVPLTTTAHDYHLSAQHGPSV